jgi:hypothetical protein
MTYASSKREEVWPVSVHLPEAAPMIVLIPSVILLIGLGLGGGLFYASYRMRQRLESIKEARPCKVGQLVPGHVKFNGRARAVNPDELLTSPIEQRPCVHYRLRIEQFRSTTTTTITPFSYRNRSGGGTWETIIEDVEAIPMVVADETGEVAIDPKLAQLDFRVDRRHANLFTSLPREIEESLRAKYKIVTSNWFIPKQMRYTEVVITQDQEVFVVGDCEVHDGQPYLLRKEHPLLMTFRNEHQVLRNGNIAATICLVLACVFPLLFLALAGLILKDMLTTFNPSYHAAQNGGGGGRDGGTRDPIARIKNSGASLSDRAWAARKLAETPANSRAAEVAPHLNPLLESSDNFHRESAVLAIKQGWGSAVNEPALRRIQQSTRDARFQKDVSAALNRIGG